MTDLDNPSRLADLQPAYEIASRKEYDKRLKALQIKMQSTQQAYFHQRRRAVVVFEGWDASGKGGAIRRLTERLDPRGYKVWPIAAPNAEDQEKHYLYRFWTKLPSAGTMALFDRSWYGRVLVERLEGFANNREWKRAYGEINEFEKMLSDDGVRIVKIFMHISPEEQLKRFVERIKNPQKRWKITEEDLRNRQRWQDYEEATEDMFRQTDTEHAPWKVIRADRKWYARIRVLELITDKLSDGVDLSAPPLDPAIVASAAKVLGLKIEQKITVTPKQ